VQESARTIHADNVHILIDLAGHSALNALRVFAWRAAPVQLSWLGYFASTGVAEIDYLIADRIGVPENQHAFFTESIWYLPETRLCFSAPNAQPDEVPSSAPALANGYVTFGSFQTSAKLNDVVLRTWGEVLLGCANARLRIQNGELATEDGRAELAQRLQTLGIDLSRVELCSKESRARYLAQYAQVDIVLDSFPFPGGTTTCEALWMGVPTLTLQGQTMIARQGASLLTAAGLGDWIAHSPAEFVALALKKAEDINALVALRAGLRERLASSPLMASERFAKSLSEAFWAMWQKRLAAGYAAQTKG
jgi:protein O-GlcNAc transferase